MQTKHQGVQMSLWMDRMPPGDSAIAGTKRRSATNSSNNFGCMALSRSTSSGQ